MLRKNYLVFCFLLVICNSIFAQREKVENLPNFDKPLIHFGFYLGLNQNSYKINYKTNSTVSNPDIETVPDIGFNVGLIGDLKLHKNVNFRFEPGLISNTKTIYFNHITTGAIDSTRTAGNTYLHLPFVFKFSTDRLNNIRPYVLTGVSYDHNFSSNQKNGNDNFSGEFRQKTSNFMYELGIGIDIYLPYFKLSPSIRGLFAINNELKYDNTSGGPWTDPINFMGTRGVFLHIAFE